MTTDIIQTDVLILGAGGAGLRAALEAAQKGVRVSVLSKGPIPGGATSVSGGVMQAAVDRAQDSPDQHLRDTVIGGRFINNQKIVRTFVDNAPQKVMDLERYGCAFDRHADGSIDLRQPSGATRKRGIEGEANNNVQKILAERALEQGASIYEYMMVTRLLQDENGAVVGASILNMANGQNLAFICPATILAAGAVGRLYRVTACPRSSTGDGLALARRVGAKMVNLEMMQFIPLAYAYPDFIKGFTLGEAPNYGHNTRFLNANGERYMPAYDAEHAEYTTRDRAARANYIEIQEGRGTPHGGIWVDPTANDPKDGLYQPHKLLDRYQMIVDFYGQTKADFEEPFEATPSALFLIGGVEIDPECRTSVPGLFAAGEIASNLHGANRLGANALTEIQVFGAIAGNCAAREALQSSPIEATSFVSRQIEEDRMAVRGLHDLPKKRRAAHLKREIQNIMWDNVGVVRDGSKLSQALDQFNRLKEIVDSEVGVISSAKRFNYDWIEALEVRNMLELAQMMATSALHRTESRGAHYRVDYPREDNSNWLRETVVQEVNGRLVVDSQPASLDEFFPSDLAIQK
jgi:fumarate reductase (CoM/CoB) subunit A